jgi:hypothetical protein
LQRLKRVALLSYSIPGCINEVFYSITLFHVNIGRTTVMRIQKYSMVD